VKVVKNEPLSIFEGSRYLMLCKVELRFCMFTSSKYIYCVGVACRYSLRARLRRTELEDPSSRCSIQLYFFFFSKIGLPDEAPLGAKIGVFCKIA
jgi:hypothetical protein